MKLLILQEILEYTAKRILEEGEKNPAVTIKHIKYTDLKIKINNEVPTVIQDTKGDDILQAYDKFIFRSARINSELRHSRLVKSLKYLIRTCGKYSLNQDFTRYHIASAVKIHNYIILANQGLPIINTNVFFNTNDVVVKSYPIIAKLSTGSHGENVSIIHNEQELESYLSKVDKISEVLFQDFIESIDAKGERYDIRTIVIGDKVIGGMKKSVNKSTFITKDGDNNEAFPLNDEIIDISLKTAKVLGLEYAGLDIIFDNGRPLIIEVNSSSQFESFERATGINVAKELVDYLVKQHIQESKGT